MSFEAKYIVIDDCIPIVFSETIEHKRMAIVVRGEVTGAGFVCIDEDGYYHCYGESVSLNIKSRGIEDSAILNKYLGVNKVY